MTLPPARWMGLSLTLLALAACEERPAPSAETTAEAPSAAAPVVEGRVVAITADLSGYAPKEIPAKVGETLILRFTRTTESECLAQIAVPSLKLKEDLPLNTPVDVVVKAEAAGEIPFRCGMAMIFGKIVVSAP